MVDLHCHILPELDDGARSLCSSIAMARMAAAGGVTVMAATPHCGETDAREVYGAWSLLRQALAEAQIPLTLLPGMEIFGTAQTPRLLLDGKLLTLNGSQYPLVEFSFRSDGEAETRILKNICSAGFRPIIAHPERYTYVQQSPRVVNRWVRMGCLLQINRGSLLGRFGPSARAMAFELLARGFAAAVASDAHSPRVRTPWLQDVQALLSRTFSPGCARALLLDNPGKILRDEPVSLAQPEWF